MLAWSSASYATAHTCLLSRNSLHPTPRAPCSHNSSGLHELYINLPPDEASDVLNFVLKDDATNTWYDNNSSNFRVPLRANADAGPRVVEVLPKVCVCVRVCVRACVTACVAVYL